LAAAWAVACAMELTLPDCAASATAAATAWVAAPPPAGADEMAWCGQSGGCQGAA
jgi:hypothetical protein